MDAQSIRGMVNDSDASDLLRAAIVLETRSGRRGHLVVRVICAFLRSAAERIEADW